MGFFEKKSEKKEFELVLQPRDKNGNPVGPRKSIATDSPFELAKFWYNNSPPAKKKSKVKKKKQRYKEVLPKGKEAEELLRQINDNAGNSES